jgi:threonine synthase
VARAGARIGTVIPADLPDVSAGPLRRLSAPVPRGDGLWRYAPSLPVAAAIGRSLSMGEGGTPLIDAGGGVSFKLEFLSPTLSFKDRGAVVLVAAAIERGAERLIADSSGNAGSAIAAYAARGELECMVFVPAGTSEGKQAQIRAYGASVEVVPGDRTAATEAAIDEVRRTGATYASHVYDPYFLEGTKTFAYELWEQLDHGVPDAVIVPVGHGTLLLGAEKGFRELRQAGLIERMPGLIAVQSERCAPVAAAWDRGSSEPVAIEAQPTVAEGIAIPRPPRGRQILRATTSFVTVPEGDILQAQRDLARRGLFVEPTAAVAWAGALRAGASGRVVVPLCGAGLKSGHLAWGDA